MTHEESITGISATTRLHYLKFNGNGELMVTSLAELMYKRIIDYCTEARTRPTLLDAGQAAMYAKRARKLFVHPPATADDPDQTGEAGELLLYMLVETILNAPQVVAKMELKTNPNLEVNGSDGIHMAWNAEDEIVDIYFGEAKLYQDVGAAIKRCLESIDGFHENGLLKHEFLLVTKNFKYADQRIQEAVLKLLEDGIMTEGLRVNHACLIGYSWSKYSEVFSKPAPEKLKHFIDEYTKDAVRLHSILANRLEAFVTKSVRLDVFFLPFSNVQDLRDAFNEALD